MNDSNREPEEDEDVEILPPELLNDENKQLSVRVQQLKSRLRKLRGKGSEFEDRTNIIQAHLKNVKNEIFHTQIIVGAKEKDIETENHMRMISEREINYIMDKLKKLDLESTAIMERTDIDKSEIFKGNEKLDKFKLQMNFNQEELEQWALAEKQKEDDFIAVEKYRRKDEAKISELSLQYEKFQRQLERVKHNLQVELTETQTAQIELNKTAEDFRKGHVERQELIKKYQESLKLMKKREDKIKNFEKTIELIKDETLECEEQLRKKKEGYSKCVINSRELRQRIAKITRKNEKKKSSMEKKRKISEDVTEEVISLKNTIAKFTTQLTNNRIKQKAYGEDLRREEKRLKLLRQQEETVKHELSKQNCELMTLSEKNKLMEDELNKVNLREKAVLKIISGLKELIYKKHEECNKVKKAESNYIAEISGTRAQNKNLQSKILQMDQEAYKQQELLYNIGYSIQQMERKVHRAQGQRTQEQTEKLKKTIEKLNNQLEGTEKKNHILTSEWKKAQGEVRKYALKMKNLNLRKEKTGENVNELILQNDSNEKEIKRTTTKKEDLMVEHDVLRLQVKRLSDLLSEKSREVCGLENRKSQMELTYQEKEVKLEAIKKVLKAELKAAREEKRKIVLDLNDRKTVVEKLKNKFNILMKRMKTNEDGEEMTQAGFLIKAIQEREELQRRGDELDSEIRKVERELIGVDKALMLFRTDNIRKIGGLKRPKMGDFHYQQRREIQQEISRLETEIGSKIQEKNIHSDNLQDVSDLNSELMRKFKEFSSTLNGFKETSNSVVDEQKNLELKLKSNSKVKSEYYHNKIEKSKRELVDWLDLKIKNDQVLQILINLSHDDKTLSAVLQRLISEFELKVSKRGRIGTGNGRSFKRKTSGGGGSRPSTADSTFSTTSSTYSTSSQKSVRRGSNDSKRGMKGSKLRRSLKGKKRSSTKKSTSNRKKPLSSKRNKSGTSSRRGSKKKGTKKNAHSGLMLSGTNVRLSKDSSTSGRGSLSSKRKSKVRVSKIRK